MASTVDKPAASSKDDLLEMEKYTNDPLAVADHDTLSGITEAHRLRMLLTISKTNLGKI